MLAEDTRSVGRVTTLTAGLAEDDGWQVGWQVGWWQRAAALMSSLVPSRVRV